MSRAALLDGIRALAVPRLTGSDGARDAEARLRGAYEDLGFETTELPFTLSTWPGRFGLTLAGASLAATGVAAPIVLRAGAPGAALVVLGVGLGVAVLPLLSLDTATRRLPWGRLDTANLLFTRPGAAPAWLVMAHRDSKSQSVPTLLRSLALVAAILALILLLCVTALWFAGDPVRFPAVARAGGVVLAAAGVCLALSWSGNGSDGALDNASGLAALLAVAASSPPEVGFLVTDAEELGLAGSRRVAELCRVARFRPVARLGPVAGPNTVAGGLSAVRGVINVDGLDDTGSLRVAEGHGVLRRGTAPRLAAALETAAGALGVDLVRRPLPRSILVDHQPIAAAGIPALTLMRGQWRSLLRVHRPADAVDRLDGSGAAEAATVLAGALRLLVSGPEDTLRGMEASIHNHTR